MLMMMMMMMMMLLLSPLSLKDTNCLLDSISGRRHLLRHEITCWCREYLSDAGFFYDYHALHITFVDVSDMVLFKLRWL